MKILYVTTISGTMNAFLIPHIKMLHKEGYQIDLVCNLKQPLEEELLEIVTNIYNVPFERSPFSKNNYIAYKKMSDVIKNGGYDIVHTHTPVASMITRLVCKKYPKTKVFYTAHGFHFFKGAPAFNWLFYYPVEKYLSNYTDVLFTINKEDFNRAQQKLKARHTEYIPGVGIDLSKFSKQYNTKKINKNEKFNIPEESFVLLSVGELNKNKNHSVVIKAVAQLKDPTIHYVICGEGPLEEYLKDLAIELEVDKQVHLLGYRTDIVDICYNADAFVFPSLREGLGMAALEAMACGLPIITSNLHGIVDYSMNEVTGFTCDPQSEGDFINAILKIKNDKELRIKMSVFNSEYVKKYDEFNVLPMIRDAYMSYQG